MICLIQKNSLSALRLRSHAVVLCLLAATSAESELLHSRDLTFDFTQSPSTGKQVTWNDPEVFRCTEKGLAWNGPSSKKRAIRIETTEPIAVGWSWRTIEELSIRIDVVPPMAFDFVGTSKLEPESKLLARYSPDRKNWSDWSEFELSEKKLSHLESPSHIGRLEIPDKDSIRYKQYLQAYQNLDVPWRNDEEAAVSWILQQDKTFFEKQIPFIGYVQFAVTTLLPGSTPIESINLYMFYTAGGFHDPPKDMKANEYRYQLPWRFDALATDKAKPTS